MKDYESMEDVKIKEPAYGVARLGSI